MLRSFSRIGLPGWSHAFCCWYTYIFSGCRMGKLDGNGINSKYVTFFIAFLRVSDRSNASLKHSYCGTLLEWYVWYMIQCSSFLVQYQKYYLKSYEVECSISICYVCNRWCINWYEPLNVPISVMQTYRMYHCLTLFFSYVIRSSGMRHGGSLLASLVCVNSRERP